MPNCNGMLVLKLLCWYCCHFTSLSWQLLAAVASATSPVRAEGTRPEPKFAEGCIKHLLRNRLGNSRMNIFTRAPTVIRVWCGGCHSCCLGNHQSMDVLRPFCKQKCGVVLCTCNVIRKTSLGQENVRLTRTGVGQRHKIGFCY